MKNRKYRILTGVIALATACTIVPTAVGTDILIQKYDNRTPTAPTAAADIVTKFPVITNIKIFTSSTVQPSPLAILNGLINTATNTFPIADINCLYATIYSFNGAAGQAYVGVNAWASDKYTCSTTTILVTFELNNPSLIDLADEIPVTAGYATLTQAAPAAPSTLATDDDFLRAVNVAFTPTNINQIKVVDGSRTWVPELDCWTLELTPVDSSTVYLSGTVITIKYMLTRTEVKNLQLNTTNIEFYFQPDNHEVLTALINNNDDEDLNTKLWVSTTGFTVDTVGGTDTSATLSSMTGNQYYTITTGNEITVPFTITPRTTITKATSLADTDHLINVGGFGTADPTTWGFLKEDDDQGGTYLKNMTFISKPSRESIIHFLTEYDQTPTWINSSVNWDELDITADMNGSTAQVGYITIKAKPRSIIYQDLNNNPLVVPYDLFGTIDPTITANTLKVNTPTTSATITVTGSSRVDLSTLTVDSLTSTGLVLDNITNGVITIKPGTATAGLKYITIRCYACDPVTIALNVLA